MANHTAQLLLDNCTLETCSIDDSFYAYRPSMAMNAALLALFSISLVAHLTQGVWYRTWTFMIALTFGIVAEMLGYVGRIMSHIDPFSMTPFLVQICCLTIAPAFLAAGVYLSLARIVVIYGPEASRIKPQRYTQIFITADFIALVLQGAGGGLASTSSKDNGDPVVGTNVMIAGLAWQVFTILIFMILCAEYAYRVSRSTREQDNTYADLRQSKMFKYYLYSLTFAILCILTRSVYRLIELSQGWEGELISIERYFFVLEGLMVIFAVLALNVFHPGMCMREGYHVQVSAPRGKNISGSNSDSELGGNVFMLERMGSASVRGGGKVVV